MVARHRGSGGKDCYSLGIEPRIDPKGRVILAESTWDWMLLRDGDGSFVLSVVCGSVGLYEVEVVLDEETVAAYERDGLEVIVRLAADITEHPRKYWKAEARDSAG